MCVKILFFIFLGFQLVSISPAQEKTASKTETKNSYFYNLTAKEIAELEARLKAEPTDYEARIKLINYYDERQTVADSRNLQRHRLALIEYNSTSVYPLPLGLWMKDDLVKPEYIALKNAWLKQISGAKKNKQIRFNAVQFLDIEPQIAENILLEGKKIDPEDFEYSQKLIEFYEIPNFDVYGKNEETKFNERLIVLKKIIAEAQNALILLNKKPETDESIINIRRMLAVCAKYALEAGDLSLVKIRRRIIKFSRRSKIADEQFRGFANRKISNRLLDFGANRFARRRCGQSRRISFEFASAD